MSEMKPKYPQFRDPKENNPPPKRKKNAPDRPQPAWLFPPEKDNPILNPKPKDDEKLRQEASEREKSLDYMKRRVHAVPDRPAPPPQLLTLVGAFLTENGFNSTSRLFTNERKARQTLNGWEEALGKKLEKGLPSLEKIYRDFYKQWQIAKADEASSSSSDGEESSDTNASAAKSNKTGNDEETSSEDDDSSDSAKDEPKSKLAASKVVSSPSMSASSTSDSEEEVPAKTKTKRSKKGKSSSRSSSSSSSSSDSDADDEQEPVPTKASPKPSVPRKVNDRKRKASPSSSESSTSSDSSEDGRPALKKIKTAVSTAKIKESMPQEPQATKHAKPVREISSSSLAASTSEPEAPPSLQKRPVLKSTSTTPFQKSKSPSPSSSSDSDSSSSESQAGVKSQTSAPADARTRSVESTSSATISGDAKQESKSSASSLTSETSGLESALQPSTQNVKAVDPSKAQKHKGAKPTPLATAVQSVAAQDETHPSNAYVPYDYAERAYNDLSVTRGKNFTKEKNKKKRGSYRGGAIDTGGGKGFKFTD